MYESMHWTYTCVYMYVRVYVYVCMSLHAHIYLYSRKEKSIDDEGDIQDMIHIDFKKMRARSQDIYNHACIITGTHVHTGTGKTCKVCLLE